MKKLPAALVATLAAACPVAVAQELVAHFDFSETTGTAFLDASGHGQDGLWMNAPTLGQPGPAGTAVELDPAALHQGDLMMPPQLDLQTSDCTVAAWVQATDFGGVRRILANDGSWAFGANGDGLRFTTRTVLDYDVDVGLIPGQWYHLAAVFDASYDVTFYVDGALVGSVFGSAPANAPLPLWHVGALRRDFELWEGMIDDIQVYSGSLDSLQILQLFQNPGEPLSDAIGLSYCTANANSTGVPAELTALGSESAAAGDVTLVATDLPARAFVLFITGRNQGFAMNPGGSAGNLCLAGPFAGYFSPGQVMNSGAAAEATLVLDLSQTPTSTGMVAVGPGETWNFQAWYRDAAAGTPTSNLTGGVAITFQ